MCDLEITMERGQICWPAESWDATITENSQY